DARHYPDLHVLAGHDEVRAMLASDEYREIRTDYDENSRKFFPKSYCPPEDLSFAESPALFPDEELREVLSGDYDNQCGLLFSRAQYPSFDEVLARFEEIRDVL